MPTVIERSLDIITNEIEEQLQGALAGVLTQDGEMILGFRDGSMGFADARIAAAVMLLNAAAEDCPIPEASAVLLRAAASAEAVIPMLAGTNSHPHAH